MRFVKKNTNKCMTWGGVLLNRKGIIPAFAVILTILTILISVGYSALNQNLSVSGEAFLRAKDNIRISRIELSDAANDGYETYNPEYSKRTTKMYTTLPKDNSSVTYTVKVTNSTGIKYKVDSIEITSTNSDVSCTPSIEKDSVIDVGVVEFTVTANYKNGMSQDTNLNACDIKYEFVPLDVTPPTLAVQLVNDNGNTKTIKIIAIDEADGSGISNENNFKYYLSTSNTTLTGGEWKDYTNNTEFEINGDFEVKYLWIYPVQDKAGNINDSKASINTAYVIKTYTFVDNAPTLYNVIAKEALTGGVAKLYTGEHNDTYNEIGTKNIYYFNGTNSKEAEEVLNKNNVVFAGFCWQMIRTTDTGGVKLIYNGTVKEGVEITPISESEYNVTSNDESYPYTYDSSANTWTSTMHTDSSSGTIIFKINKEGTYYLNYTVSSEKSYDKATFYKNGTQIGQYSGSATGSIKLDSLLTSDEIKVVYRKDESYSSGSDNVIFSVGTPSGEVKQICNNSGTEQQIGELAFNSNYNSPAYVGYMYNTVYTYKVKSMSSSDVYKYAKSFTYSNGTYKLSSDAISIDVTNSTDKTNLNNAHYTCFNETGECSTIYYIYYVSGTYLYYIELNNGTTVEKALEEMLSADNVNQTNSTIKTTIDTWYENNMTSYTEYLEDTVFCNDRSISSYNGWNPDGGSVTDDLQFKNYNTVSDLYCTNETDRFSVGNSKAKLTYPVGLMTMPEMKLLGYNSIRATGQVYWLASPVYFLNTYPRVRVVYGIGNVNYDYDVRGAGGARPSVSLASGTGYSTGTGSVTDPYIVDLNAPTVVQETIIDGDREKTVRITVSDDYGLSSENKYKYYLSTSETELVGGEWKEYTSGEIFTITGENETKYLWIYPVMDNAWNINDGKADINTPYVLLIVTFKDKTYLYDVLQKEYASGRGLAKLYTGQHNDTYDEIGTQNIYHFYGADNTAATNVLTKNNVIFAGFCWQMIRTTDTGGVKLIYNGVPKETNGKKVCTNSGTEQQIETSKFNPYHDSPAYVGYMYNTIYLYERRRSSTVYKYAKSFTYSNGKYKLSSDAISIDVTNSTERTKVNNAHYTCFNTTGECETMYYIYFLRGTIFNYIELKDGKSVENALNEMLSADNVNLRNSTIKDTVDTWYANNMTNYTKYLEDTVFCNDRSISDYGGWNPNGGSASSIYLEFKNRNITNDLYCTNVTDRFSVGNEKAKLTYPVGLMSAPEMYLLSNNSIRKTGQEYWLLSPSGFYTDDNIVYGWRVNSVGYIYGVTVDSAYSVRPAVSLAPGTQYVAGTGSATDPYVILTN